MTTTNRTNRHIDALIDLVDRALGQAEQSLRIDVALEMGATVPQLIDAGVARWDGDLLVTDAA